MKYETGITDALVRSDHTQSHDQYVVPWPLFALARACEEGAVAKGWDPCTFDNMPGKLMMACTEINEARDALPDLGNLHEEIADTAIRLLAILHGVFGDDWADRRVAFPNARAYAFEPIEVLLWPTLRHVCRAAEYWRKDNREDVRISLEFALRETFYNADRLGFDLTEECVRKLAVNAQRPALHGKKRSLG